MNEAQRRRIQANFVLLFGDLPVRRRAEMLGVSVRSIHRIETERHAPIHAVALKMQCLTEEAVKYASMSPAEREAAQDSDRVRREARQRQIVPDFDHGDPKRYPPFMRTALKRLIEGQYETVIDVLRDRVDSPQEWRRIPREFRPYVLETLAFALRYTGRTTEEIELYSRALDEMGLNPMYGKLRQACLLMLASAYQSLGQLQHGFAVVEKIIDSSRGFVPAYYNGLCLAAATRDPQTLAQWIGRIIEASKSSWTGDELRRFLERCQGSDPDLRWARHQELWSPFISRLQSVLDIMISGETLPRLGGSEQ